MLEAPHPGLCAGWGVGRSASCGEATLQLGLQVACGVAGCGQGSRATVPGRPGRGWVWGGLGSDRREITQDRRECLMSFLRRLDLIPQAMGAGTGFLSGDCPGGTGGAAGRGVSSVLGGRRLGLQPERVGPGPSMGGGWGPPWDAASRQAQPSSDASLRRPGAGTPW